MAMLTTCNRRPTFIRSVATGMTPNRLEQYRLDRLLELRAVIESLRSQEPDDIPATHPEPRSVESGATVG